MSDISLDQTLHSIREVMRSPKKNSSKQNILELTEDDLVNEEDKEAFEHERIKPSRKTNSSEVNDFLTSLPHSIDDRANSSHKLEESFYSAKNAAKSLANIKKMIKDSTPALKAQDEKSRLLEDLITSALHPMLQEWLDKNLKSIVKEMLNEKLRDLNLKNNQE